MNQIVDEVVSGHVSEDEGSDVYELLTEVLHCDDDVQNAEVDGVNISEQVTVTDAFTNTDLVSFSDVGIQNTAVLVHVDVQTDQSETKDAEIQATVITEEASTDINTKLLGDKDVSTSTDDLDVPSHRFSIEAFKDDDKAIRFYTGFPSFMCLMICYNFLGPAVAPLFYYEKSCGKETSVMGHHKSLTHLNELFLILCWLRVGLKEQDLAYRLGISQSTVSRIVTTWINFMFYKFKEIPIWPSRQVVDQFMPDCFHSLYPGLDAS